MTGSRESWRFYGPDGDVIIEGDDRQDCMRQFASSYHHWDAKRTQIEKVH